MLTGFVVVFVLLVVLGLPGGLWFARELATDRELRHHGPHTRASREAPHHHAHPTRARPRGYAPPRLGRKQA
jgi:hypothetical protein